MVLRIHPGLEAFAKKVVKADKAVQKWAKNNAGKIAIMAGAGVTALAYPEIAGTILSKAKNKGSGKSKRNKKGKNTESKERKQESEHLLGENGTQTKGSKTTGKNGKTERVDVENQVSGKREGDVHYHEPDNTKWRYDVKSGKFVNPENKELASPKIQSVLQKEWFRKAIKKALEILGEEW